jgi:hypothetical protein
MLDEFGTDSKNYCHICGRTSDQTELNYEAIIHHGAKNLECIDRKSCNKHARKKRRTK